MTEDKDKVVQGVDNQDRQPEVEEGQLKAQEGQPGVDKVKGQASGKQQEANKAEGQASGKQQEVNKVEGQASEPAKPVKITLEEAIKQKLAQKKQTQANDKFNPKQSPNSTTMRNQHGSNRNSALGRRNKV